MNTAQSAASFAEIDSPVGTAFSAEARQGFNPKQPFKGNNIVEAMSLRDLTMRLVVSRILLANNRVPQAAASLKIGPATVYRYRNSACARQLLEAALPTSEWSEGESESRGQPFPEDPFHGLDLLACSVDQFEARIFAARFIRKNGEIDEVAKSLELGTATVYRWLKREEFREPIPSSMRPRANNKLHY